MKKDRKAYFKERNDTKRAGLTEEAKNLRNGK